MRSGAVCWRFVSPVEFWTRGVVEFFSDPLYSSRRCSEAAPPQPGRLKPSPLHSVRVRACCGARGNVSERNQGPCQGGFRCGEFLRTARKPGGKLGTKVPVQDLDPCAFCPPDTKVRKQNGCLGDL